LIERITGMRTVVGDEIREEPINAVMVKAVCQAFLVLHARRGAN
jgi:hypothetical protein